MLSLLLAACFFSDEIAEKPSVVFPIVPVLDQKDVPAEDLPAPPPRTPKFISELSEETWLVIESPSPIVVTSSPLGHVNVQPEEGPVRVRGKFADGTGKIETRVFSSKHLYFVNAVKSGKVEILIYIPESSKEEKDILRYTLNVMGVMPIPPPDPVVPTPVDPVVPIPVDPVVPVVPTGKLQIVIIEDPGMTLPSSQVAAKDGQALRDYAASHCSKTDGAPDIRKLSIRQDVSTQPEWVKKAFAEPRSSVPFLVVSNGTAGAALPFPLTIEETLTILKKYGGE